MKLGIDRVHVYTTLGLLLCLVRQTLCAECPPDAPERAMQCVAAISGSGRQTGESLLSDWDLQKIGKACDEGTFDQSISCAERIVDSCKDYPEQGANLNKYLNIPLLKQGVTRLCTQTVTGLHGDSECIQRQKPLVKSCADAEFEEFQYKVSQLEGDLGRIKDAACELMQRVSDCQTKSVRTNCGETAAEELSDILSYFMPPYCSGNEGGGENGGDAVHVRLFAVFICSIVTVLNAWWIS